VSKIYEALKRAEREREKARDGFPVSRTEDPKEGRAGDETYRRLRASLLFGAGASELRTILVTAARHREGTSRVTLGLAAALASEEGTRVLLVEANLHSPALGRRLSLDRRPGVGDFLAGKATVDQLILPVESLGLSVVLAGALQPHANSESIESLLAELEPQFDYVLIDAAPVNRYADSSVLAAKVDGVILVVEADRTPVVEAEAAKRNLDRAGARILGAVLNRQRSYLPAMLQGLF
jgi:capsular exopolysaccharide synthesis family protein